MSHTSEGTVDGRLVTFFFLVALIMVGALPSHADKSARSTSPWGGRDVFQNKGCADCHAIHGTGGDDGPDLGEKHFGGTRLQLAALMWKHVPGMLDKMKERQHAFPRMNEKEMDELITYLSYQRYSGVKGNERTGRKLLKKKKCVLCHKFGGEGGDIGPDICSSSEYFSPLKMVTSMWNHGPDMMPYFEENDVKRPEFKRNEIVDIAAGIRSFMRATTISPGSYDMGDAVNGKKLAKDKGCLHCHAVNEEGGDIGPELRDLDFRRSVTEIAGMMWNHGPKMWAAMEKENVPFPVFTEGEMADLLGYLFALELDDPPGNPDKGADILRKKCSGCHAVPGGGVPPEMEQVVGMQSPLEMIAVMWNHAPEMREKQLETKLDWPELDEKQMAHIYAYLKNMMTRPKTAK